MQTEGNTLSVILTGRELIIFSTEVTSDLTKAHMIAVTLNDEEMNLYFDAESLVTVKMSDFF